VNHRRALVVALSVLAVTGCGVPTRGTAELVNPGDVPYGLLTSGPAATTPTQATVPRGDQPHLYWLDNDDRAIAAPVSGTGTGPAALNTLLARLTEGPTDSQRRAGLGTALSPQTSIRVRALSQGVADLEVRSTLEDPAADRLPLAVGQIVLTATSVPGVDAVRLLRDGRTVAAPLLGGALTTEPVNAFNYAELLRPLTDDSPTGPGPSS
jgi:hypothetical protein